MCSHAPDCLKYHFDCRCRTYFLLIYGKKGTLARISPLKVGETDTHTQSDIILNHLILLLYYLI